MMCFGVSKSGSPRLKSNTLTPAAFNSRALAPAASVAEGWTDDANGEVRIIGVGNPRAKQVGVSTDWSSYYNPRRCGTPNSPRTAAMHVAHFVHRYPPALGGCEA